MVLVTGLDGNSRIGQKMAGLSVPLDTFLMAMIVDDLNALLNGYSKRPQKLKSIAKDFMEKPKMGGEGFETVEELERARSEFLRRK